MASPPVDVFISYARADEAFRSELETHLAPLKRQGVVRDLHNQQIQPGDDWRVTADAYLEAARIILLLVSADYLASDECEAEMTRALVRHRSGKATVIPVLIRECHFSDAPFAAIKPLPGNAIPVTSWDDRDKAWKDVVGGVRAIAVKESPREARADRRAAESPLARPAPKPSREVEAFRLMSSQLEAAFVRKRELTDRGLSTASVEQEILDLRRRFRQGGQLRAGDSLADGRYLLVEPIGRGSFGAVWEAYDRERRERVAIKVLHANIVGDPVRRERFFRGARVMAELKHNAIVRILEPYGEDDGYFYFVMEFVPGKDLRRAVLAREVRSVQVLPIVLRVAEAVSVAHAKSIVHRDIKPANILLDAFGSPRLTDFDLVAAPGTTGGTKTGALGTWLYAAPELMDRPEGAGAAADVYSLGMTAIFGLYGTDLPQIIIRDPASIINKLPCKEDVKRVLSRAVEWAAGERYASAGAFVEALRRANAVTSGAAVAAPQVAPSPPSPNAAPPSPSPKAVRPSSPRPAPAPERDVGQGPSPHRPKIAADIADAPPAGESAPADANEKRGHVEAPPELPTAGSACRALAFSRRGAFMASGHKDGSIFLWDVSSWKPISAFSTDTAVKSVALTSSGSLIAAGSRGGAVRLWDVETRRERATIAERSAGAVAFHPDDERIAVTPFGYSLLIVHVGGGANPRVLEGHTAHIMSLAFSPDGSMLASGSFDGSVRVWDVNGKAEPRILVGHKVTSGRHGGLQGIRTVAFSRDGGLVASGAEDGTAWLWDARTGVQRRPFVTGQHPVKSVAFSPDGIWLALGTRGSVSVRSLHGDEVRIFQGAADSIRAVAWLPAATILAIASDEAIDLWNVVTGEVRRVLTVVRSSGRKRDV